MQQLDTTIFYFVNKTLTNPFFDNTLPHVTDLHKSGYALVVAAIAVVAYVYYRKREALAVLLLGFLAVAFTDLVTTYVIKPTFQRKRPTAAIPEVALRTPVHYGYSFPSNHSANSFALATVLAHATPAVAIPAYGIAILISFSRVYVGVHFPFDVLAGAMMGYAIGWLVWRFGRDKLRLRRRA